MSENKVNGPEDAVVNEMIKRLPLEKIYINFDVFSGTLHGIVGSTEFVEDLVKLVFLRKSHAGPKKGIRNYRAIALTSVMSKW